jgi:hypothetical protein
VTAPSAAAAQSPVQAASTVDGSELVQTVPITRKSDKSPAVVLSIGSGELPNLGVGDTLRSSAELQVSTTCVESLPRCIGKPYSYSPTFSAQIVLASSRTAASGSGTLALSPEYQMGCGQQRPNRNHHCLLTIPGVVRPILPGDQLPCVPSQCSLNLVVSAHAPKARRGNVLVIGNDQPNGTVKGGRGRLNAIVTAPGEDAFASSTQTTERISKRIPLGGEHSGFQTVAYSVRLDGLQPGDVISATALQSTGVGSLAVPAFVGDQIILTTKPTSARPKKKYSTQDGELTPANGFNCTQGSSPYQTPCSTYKTGQLTITKQPLDNFGLPKPLYVNLITRAFEKTAQAKRGDRVTIRGSGYLNVVRYPG